MNWFDTSGLTSLAKTALKGAQKTIDKALDIQDESDDENSKSDKQSDTKAVETKKEHDFFASWGLTTSGESCHNPKEQPVVTESPTKSSQVLWGSFGASFFEHPKSNEELKENSPALQSADSLGMLPDSKSLEEIPGSCFELPESAVSDINEDHCKEMPKTERRGSSRSNLSSSESVEILSHSLKTTPDSETVSVHSVSHSSSMGHKLLSDSVEIIPESLISPGSIECLGYDSEFIPSPLECSDKKSISLDERENKSNTADSVSLVADDDEDTVSYNSVSECTAPTILDGDDKIPSFFMKLKDSHKVLEKDVYHLELPVSQKQQISENSSNDGSCSDKTINADSDSVNLENVEEQKKDDLIEIQSNSSFCDVNVGNDMMASANSAFFDVEKPTDSSSEPTRKNSKERTSPISSDGKSDLVKIGSETSGDELETATSSDIEVIPSPNGDNNVSRSSPGKAFKNSKFDGATSPNLVELVLGKTLASKIRGHNRELSEASIQSNGSDDSQNSENDRLMKRLSEMAEILEARETKLLEVSRNNADLAESNADLKSQLETLIAKNCGSDLSSITDDYTQRMSALEKKFQQAIREKDQLRKKLDALKSDSSRKSSSEMESQLKEKDEMIMQLQEEGEKLAAQRLQHSNIIKRLRAKDKDNEQVIKNLRDKIAEQTSELDRLKRSVSAKEEVEVSQIEAVYRLTNTNKKLETELMETCSELEDTKQSLEAARTALEASRSEAALAKRAAVEIQATRARAATAERRLAEADAAVEELRAQLQQLRADMVAEEKRWARREQAWRREAAEAREALAAAEARGAASGSSSLSGTAAGSGEGAAALLAQLAALQVSAAERDAARDRHAQAQARKIEEAESALAKAVEKERLSLEEVADLKARLATAEHLLEENAARLTQVTDHCQRTCDRLQLVEEQLASKTKEVEQLRSELEAQTSSLNEKLKKTELILEAERSTLEIEKKRNILLQEQLSARAEPSPTPPASIWTAEEYGRVTPCAGGAGGAEGEEGGRARAWAAERARLEAERRALRDHVAALHARLELYQGVSEQHEALLQMYGEKEEQALGLALDVRELTRLCKRQQCELAELRAAADASHHRSPT